MTSLVLLEESPSAGTRHEVQEGATIGREACEVVLADPEVSRRHARIRSLDRGPAIEDLGSTNGTFLNGQRVTGVAALTNGDALKLGNSSLRVEVEVPDGATRLTPVAQAPTGQLRTPPMPMPAETPTPAEPPRPAEAPPPAQVPAPAPPPLDTPPAARVETPPAAPPETPPAASPETPPAPRVETPRAARGEAPPAPSPPAPEASPPTTSAGGARGDVPAPPPASASRVHHAFTGAPAAPQQAFRVEEPRTRRGSAATRVEATVVSYGVVIATAVAVTLYLIERGG